MARIRSLKPDFFDDEDLAEFPFWIRILYEGLWCYADKAGRLEDRPMKLKAKIFPYDKVNIEVGLQELAKPKKHSPTHPPFILRYEIEGNKYIQILTWDKHESPHHTEKESNIPASNGVLTVKDTLDKSGMGDAQDPNKDQGPRTKDQGGQKDNFNSLFEEFWKVYPKEGKVERQTAYKKFIAIAKVGKLEELKEGFRGYMDFLKHRELNENFKQRAKDAKTFLNHYDEYSGFYYKVRL